MKEDLRADAMTRAAQIATSAVKQKFLDDGGRLRDFRISDHASAIAAIAASDEIIERATKDIERWRSKFTSGAQRKRR